MTHTYHITGMTCEGCRAKVQKLLGQVEGVTAVDIDLGKGEARIGMGKHVPTDVLRAALKDYPKYQITEVAGTEALARAKAGMKSTRADVMKTAEEPAGADAAVKLTGADAALKLKGVAKGIGPAEVPETLVMTEETEARSWLATYKPILLIFGYISFIALAAGSGAVMRVFMSGFFLTFSFFKLLDLKGFAESYSQYDLVASRWSGWGYLYAFIELGLGISFALNFQPLLTNWVTLIVMVVSIIGVLKSVLNKRKIRCACLGAVFNLPMSTVTIVEDAVMIVMSAATLAVML